MQEIVLGIVCPGPLPCETRLVGFNNALFFSCTDTFESNKMLEAVLIVKAAACISFNSSGARVRQKALDILSDDCELRGLGGISHVATKRIAANRVSQMTKKSIVRLGASTPEMGAEIQPEPNPASTNVDATQVMQISSRNSYTTLEDDALDYECHLQASKVSVAL